VLLIKTLIHTILLPGTIVVGLPYLILSDSKRLSNGLGPSWFPGVVLIIVGLAIGCWCTWDFIVTGKGTPNPLDPPKLLIAQGPYRLVRNPMYVCVAAVLLGEVLIFGSLPLLVYTAVVLLCFHLFVVLYEEPTLERMFGESYEQYRQRVPRWIPRWPGKEV
jgi:protein-S-isoprenylcysteine O-methyltransferase Ste14